MDFKKLPVAVRINKLVESLDGSEKMNKALSSASDGDEMITILIGASSSLGLGLTKDDLVKTPPIRDWIWWKNKQALLTLGSGTPRHQQDKNSKVKRLFERLF
tara:strand:+ start:270 stop:578 length:309 start_codon:yes stop_codon:yes gene_type:complete